MFFGRTSASLRHVVAISALFLAAPPTLSDTVKLTNRSPFEDVQLTFFGQNAIIFRGVSGEHLRKPLDEIEWLAIDDAAAFSRAEQALHRGAYEAAADDYRSALAPADTPWLRRLIRVRLVASLDRAGRFAEAVDAFIELARETPSAARRHTPQRPDRPGSARNRAALGAVERALADESLSEAARAALEELTLALRLHEGLKVETGAAGVQSPYVPDRRPEERPLGILPPADGEPETRPSTQPAAGTGLGSDSLVYHAAAQGCDTPRADWAAELLSRALPHVAAEDRDAYRLLWGRCRINAGEAAAAAADLLELAEDAAHPAVRAWASFHVGRAHEKLRRPDIARRVYEELVDQMDVPAEVRTRATERLAALGADDP